MMEKMGLPRNTSWKGYQAHHVIPKALYNHPALKKIGYNIDEAGNGIFLRNSKSQGISTMTRHQGSHAGYNNAMKKALDKLDINKATNELLKDVQALQSRAKKGLESGLPIRSKDMYSRLNTKLLRRQTRSQYYLYTFARFPCNSIILN